MRPAYIATIGLVLFYIMSALTGALFSLTGFIQSDTCWLVKIGTLILHTHNIPTADPLSFTIPLLSQHGFEQPFVIYQWLSEVIFACTFRAFQLNGLLVLCSAVTTLASIALLFRLCLRASGSLLSSFFVSALAAASVALRLMVRPELFTILFIVIWLSLLSALRNQDSEHQTDVTATAIDLRTIILLSITMLAWCNTHTGFVIGLALLLIYTLSSLVKDLVNKTKITGRTRTALIALTASCLMTLLNPAGTGLWGYLPRLFFPRMNLDISETQAMGVREILMPIYYPYFLLIVFSFYAVVRVFRSRKPDSSNILGLLFRQGRLSSIASIVVAIAISLGCKRLVSPMAIILAYEASSLLGGLANQLELPPFFKSLKSVVALEIPVLLFSITGVMSTSDRLVPLTMPQASIRFIPSFPAIEYIQDHWQGGNIFNDAQIGSMLTIYGPPGLKVFIDTRLDAYGERILQDYCDLIDGRTRSKALLDFYLIDWVIITPHDRLAVILQKSPEWKTAFEDENAVIFRRAK